MKVYKRWNTAFFPWVLDNEWILVQHCVSDVAAEEVINHDRNINGLSYQYKVVE